MGVKVDFFSQSLRIGGADKNLHDIGKTKKT